MSAAANCLAIYQTDRLFLLMGENPLPNYVAALSLLKPDGIPYLIHTAYTQVQAERFAAILNKLSGLKSARLVNLGHAQGDAYAIHQVISAIARDLTGSVGMNYTGGTKAMSVHAYRVLEQLHPEAIFSYLDSNTLEMIIDQDQQPSVRFKVRPQLSLEHLFQLHGLSWQSHQPPVSKPIQAVAATRLAQLHQSEINMKLWRSWCNHALRQEGKNEYGRWKPEEELAQLPSRTLSNLSTPFKSLLQQYFEADSNHLRLQTAGKQGFNSITQLCEWLDGTWLEHYTLFQIQKISAQCNIHESGLSFRIQDSARPNGWDKFEFDVAFMRHYQLFAISCTTTGKRSLCKQKLIEANLRARQLGGAEARVALVCCHQYPDSLRSELEVATRNRKIAVFGRSDLPDLGQKIVNWVKQNG
ncbi:DUF1887 family protein [Cyanobacteria bacterium FACHB-DQ100]|nr:DUF1887 family protein [Cyanobacteria bacterium FACHB-DQ100]